MEQSLPQSFDPSSLRESVLIALLSGNQSPASIMYAIEQNGEIVEKHVGALLRDPAFLREVEQARQQIDETVVGWFKKRGLKYAKRMDTLSENQDPRVAFQATKDLLDRIGTKPEAKIAVSGISQYKKLLEELAPEPAAEEPKGE